MVNEQEKNLTKMDLKSRTKEFALRCMKLCAALPSDWVGNHLKYQLFKSSTSVAANYRSACASQSRKSFLSKLGIVVEEADEAVFWIEFIMAAHLLTEQKCEPLLAEARELTAIFVASQKTTRKNDHLKMENRKF
ncbi:MAG: four helix bundle protein [Planctomycetes bacterium]|jgi:four helix bundle protein|nr:four helix bundle protein [Planctomycetota bacterium]